MPLSSVTQQVRAQYEMYPYPYYPIWAAVRPESSLHASFEAGAALVHGANECAAGKKILLLGSGTFEPLAMAAIHRKSELTAVDLSARTLARARWRCRLYRKKNVTFVQDDLVAFCLKNKSHFDYIHCYGVLHHLEEPQQGFDAIAGALKPEGFARLMVYSEGHRRRHNLLRQTLQSLGIKTQTRGAVKQVRDFLRDLSLEHPFKALSLLNSDNFNSSGLVDSLLHACEHSFSLIELKAVIARAGLRIAAWDLNASMLGLMSEPLGGRPPNVEHAAAIDDRIERLEAFSQWPGSFTFWVAKKAPPERQNVSCSALTNGEVQNADSDLLVLNPHLHWHGQNSFHSTLLRKKLIFSAEQKLILERLCLGPVTVSHSALATATRLSLDELLAARLILKVRA